MAVRAVSLVPSITETLRGWGVDPIACTRYCEQPDLPTIGGTKNPDVDAIVALGPDVVLLDRVENRREDADALLAAGVPVVALDVRTLDDVDPELDRLATAVGLARSLSSTGRGENPPIERSAFVPIWRRPYMTIGPDTYGSTLLEAIGVSNIYRTADSDYPQVDLDQVAARRPDIVLAPSEPYDFQPAHLDELAEVAPVLEVDGQDLFWWGIRTAAAKTRLKQRIVGRP